MEQKQTEECFQRFTETIREGSKLMQVFKINTEDSVKDVQMWKTMNALDDLPLQELKKMKKKFVRLRRLPTCDQSVDY